MVHISVHLTLPPMSSSLRSKLKPVFDHIERHRDAYVERLRTLCRQPSISAHNVGIEECVELTRTLMEDVGIKAKVIRPKEGHPALVGELQSRGTDAKTLLLYNHYDVQPPDPLEEWRSDPFAADVREGRLYARGAADDKGSLMARLCAIEALRDVLGELPVHPKFLVEGEEGIGSPHLPELVAGHGPLRADGCLWEGGERLPDGRPELYFGCKGLLYVELRAKTAETDTHSMYAPAVPNAPWRLLWALSTFKDANEHILIDGFYDDVREPTEGDLNLLRKVEFDEEEYKRIWGVRGFAAGRHGMPLVRALYFSPTCTICGLDAGYKGPGSKTVNPKEARAKMDFRLVPDQRSSDILEKVRAHLSKHGFADIEVVYLNSLEPARTHLDAKIAQALVSTAKAAYGVDPVVVPMVPGSGPMSLFIKGLRLPVASGECVGRTDSGFHAPNEHIEIHDYIQGIKHIAATVLAFGG